MRQNLFSRERERERERERDSDVSVFLRILRNF